MLSAQSCGISDMDLLSIQRPQLWSLYDKARRALWITPEVQVGEDKKAWDRLDVADKEILLRVLTFFARGDGPVAENLKSNLLRLFETWNEATCFYSVQFFIELQHAEIYQKLLRTYAPERYDELMREGLEAPFLALKNRWIKKWLNTTNRYRLLVAFTCVENIHFSTSFNTIFFYKQRPAKDPTEPKLTALFESNDFISRDEGLHARFGGAAYCELCRHPIDEEEDVCTREDAVIIIREAVDIEKKYAEYLFEHHALLGFTKEMALQAVEYQGDSTAVLCGIGKIWDTPNPCTWFDASESEQKGNFFEVQVTEYARGVAEELTLNADY